MSTFLIAEIIDHVFIHLIPLLRDHVEQGILETRIAIGKHGRDAP